jgi:hypothetical protein
MGLSAQCGQRGRPPHGKCEWDRCGCSCHSSNAPEPLVLSGKSAVQTVESRVQTRAGSRQRIRPSDPLKLPTQREGLRPIMSEASQTEDVLFEVKPPRIVKVKRAQGKSKPRWAKYRPKNPVKCDDCMLVLALAKGRGPASRQARWKRVQDAADQLLCYAHAQVRRDEDGMVPLKEWD